MEILKNKKILIVDDDTTTSKIHSLLLRKLAAKEIFEASDVDEALSLINQYHSDEEPFHLILSDLIMPEKSGLDLYRNLIIQNIHIPFLMVTANGDQKNVEKMIDLGIKDIIVKPITLEILITRISKLQITDGHGL